MIRKLALALSLTTILSACGHRPLKAPCEPGNAQPLSMGLVAILPALFQPFIAPLVSADECGPLRRL